MDDNTGRIVRTQSNNLPDPYQSSRTSRKYPELEQIYP